MPKVDILPGIKVLTHDTFFDNRGQLFTLWQKDDCPELSFNHDKVAISHKNVLRGLHTDKSWKLITCVYGKIQLVVVDYNLNSENYLNYASFIIDSDDNNKTSVLVPPGFLNGHLILSDKAVFHYKWSYEGDYPDVKDQISVNYLDPSLNIDWIIKDPIVSDRDRLSNYIN